MECTSALFQKTHVPGTYVCEICDKEFIYLGGDIKCPQCGNQSPLNLVAIYVENDPQVEALHGKHDWQAGD